jgi:non-homologous end joining protein Ku
MATRGTRNTTIAFGGFQIAVTMKKAPTSRDLKTEIVNPEGVKVNAPGGGGGGTRTLRPGQSRAVRLSDTSVIRLPQDDLDRITEHSKTNWQDMEVLEAIDYRQVPTERILGSYWLQPAQGSAKTMLMLAGALRDTSKVLVVKWCASSREKLGVIRVRGVEGKRALLLSELAFANDFLTPDEDALEINNADVDERSQGVAVSLIESFARGAGDPVAIDEASDDAVDARLRLFQRLADEQTGRELEEAVAAASDGNVIDLEAARGKAA